MNREFLVPDLGEGLQDATITGWDVAVGDHVTLNQTLCTVETNKAEVEIPSPFDGEVVELGGAAGDTLAVGAVLVRIATAEPARAVNGVEKPRKPVLVGYGTDDTMDASRRPKAAVRARAKPPVRKLAADLHVDLNALAPGTGPDGVITRDDVLSAAQGSDVDDVTGVQAAMARRMSLSHREIPDACGRVEVDCTALLALRDRMRAAHPELPVTPFVLTLRLLVVALGRHPLLNSTWVETVDGPQIHRHPRMNLGVAVAAPRGLLVPVVTDAHQLTTRELTGAVTELIEHAHAGTLTPAQLSGSTFTVSNFGALGLDDGVPMINHPEAAILGMGSIKPRAVVVEGDVAVRPTMWLTCAFDHRIIDGAHAAAFLRDLRALIEAPDLALTEL